MLAGLPGRPGASQPRKDFRPPQDALAVTRTQGGPVPSSSAKPTSPSSCPTGKATTMSMGPPTTRGM